MIKQDNPEGAPLQPDQSRQTSNPNNISAVPGKYRVMRRNGTVTSFDLKIPSFDIPSFKELATWTSNGWTV